MTSSLSDSVERLEARLQVGAAAPSKRLLIIVNPYATTVSDRLKNLVVYALRGRYQVDAVDTERRDHATEICREAAREGYDVVVAFGGDGTVNEAANGLVGSSTPLSCLPGGRANVFCRMLGIPTDIVDATEHLLALSDEWRPRWVDVGSVNDRSFVFSAGVGLDARVVEVVDAHPRRKARFGHWYYALVATRAFGGYVLDSPRLEVELGGGERVAGVTAIVQNARPYTYFGERPVEMAAEASLDSGDLGGIVLRRASPLDAPAITWRALSRPGRLTRHRRVHGFAGASALTVRSLDDRALPVQVDGDYIGTVAEARFVARRRALAVVA